MTRVLTFTKYMYVCVYTYLIFTTCTSSSTFSKQNFATAAELPISVCSYGWITHSYMYAELKHAMMSG